MTRGSQAVVPHRRRRELRTDYKRRLDLLRSGKPRLVVRKSLNNITCQVMGYKDTGDACLVSADSRQLSKFGWKANTGNVPSAYLTGLLCGKRAREKKIGEAVLDMGLHRSTHGNRLFAALKGAVDAGLSVPHSVDALPDEGRTSGAHLASYAQMLKKESSSEFGRRFSAYLKGKVSPEELPKHFEETKAKILKSG